jgi:hypothetical protein
MGGEVRARVGALGQLDAPALGALHSAAGQMLVYLRDLCRPG